MVSITRRDWLAAAAGAGAAPALRGQSGPSGRPKNVLVLMSDQHRPHALSIDGDAVARTPNLDSLARSATRFDSAYCSNPVCVPSRASLLTGLYTHHHRTWNNTVPWPFETKTAAHHFSRAGYMTGLIGKMHFVDAQTHGFDYRLDFNDWWQYLGPKARLYADELGQANSGSGLPQIDDLWRDFGDPWKGERERDGREGLVAVGRVSRIPERDHFESFIARESIRFLRQHAKQQPFFLISSFLKPHDPFMPAERFAAMFRAEEMRLPDTWGKVDLATVPKHIQDSIRVNGPTPELQSPEQSKRRIALYYASLAQMDENIGAVLATLREVGLEQDTIVVYTSDHGEMLGEHGLWQKFVFYEPSVGVPLLVRAQGVSVPGARCGTPVSQVQVLPSLLELCGLPVPGGLDGESFTRDLREPGQTRDTSVYAEYNLHTPRPRYMLRRGGYKFCHYPGDIAELYHLTDDPKEMHNLAAGEGHRSVLERMRQQLFDWYPEASAA
jgi:choline-sulfatase